MKIKILLPIQIQFTLLYNSLKRVASILFNQQQKSILKTGIDYLFWKFQKLKLIPEGL